MNPARIGNDLGIQGAQDADEAGSLRDQVMNLNIHERCFEKRGRQRHSYDP